MDEEDIIPVLCPKKTYSKQFKGVNKTTSEPNNMKQTSRNPGRVNNPCVPLTTKAAVEFLLNGKLKTTVCRYCLKVTVGLSELDQIMQIAGTGVIYKVSIREMIACFYPFKTREVEGFPDKICQKCIDRAINAYLFTQQCEQAERALHNCFDDMNEKFNKLDPLDRKKKRGRQKLNPNTNTLYAEHHKVMDYAEPSRNIINIQTELLSKEPEWNEFECKKCWQVLPDFESLLNHEKMHPKYMWYHCRLCGKSFVKLNQLKKHFNQVHIRGKGTTEVDKTFKCIECGNVTENYVQHLEHVEKHKFKSIMKHLIEKKTDKLCLICLKECVDLVDLDKIVCIHGSCPELVGDKSLYTVLASTLPDQKSYKYQELHVPCKASITTITKRKRKYKEIHNIESHSKPEGHFQLSLPVVISEDNIKTDDFYYYVFCEPQVEDSIIKNVYDNKGPTIFHITNKKIKLDDKMPIVNELVPANENSTGNNNPVCETVMKDTTKETRTTRRDKELQDSLKEVIKNYKNQEKLLETNNLSCINVASHIEATNVEDNIINVKEPINILCAAKNYRIFTEAEKSSNIIARDSPTFDGGLNATVLIEQNNFFKQFENQDAGYCKQIKEIYNPNQYLIPTNVITDMSWIFTKASESNKCTYKTTNFDDSPKIKDQCCKFCWLFKHTNKCQYCKKPIDTGVKIIEEAKQDIDKNADIYNITSDNTESPDDMNVKFQPDKTTMEKYALEPKIEQKWQCDVCLTDNEKNRSFCLCCESKKYVENGNCKFTFGNNKTFMECEQQSRMEKEVDKAIQDTFVVVDEAPVMDNNIGILQETIEIQMGNNRDTNTIYNMDIEPDTVNANLCIIDEEMDVEEETFIPNNVQQFDPVPIPVLPVPILAANVASNIQFNIDSNHTQNETGVRRIKRVIRNKSKASHK